jgi:hypothetical protein
LTYPFAPVLQIAHQALLHHVKLGNLLLYRLSVCDQRCGAVGVLSDPGFELLLEVLDGGP